MSLASLASQSFLSSSAAAASSAPAPVDVMQLEPAAPSAVDMWVKMAYTGRLPDPRTNEPTHVPMKQYPDVSGSWTVNDHKMELAALQQIIAHDREVTTLLPMVEQEIDVLRSQKEQVVAHRALIVSEIQAKEQAVATLQNEMDALKTSIDLKTQQIEAKQAKIDKCQATPLTVEKIDAMLKIVKGIIAIRQMQGDDQEENDDDEDDA